MYAHVCDTVDGTKKERDGLSVSLPMINSLELIVPLYSPSVYCVLSETSPHRWGGGGYKYEQKDKTKKIVIMHCTAALSLQVVDHLLLGDEVRGLVDQRHERVEFVRPVVEQVVGVFGPLEVDDASQPVHLGIDGLVDHQSGEELLRFLAWEESGSV